MATLEEMRKAVKWGEIAKQKIDWCENSGALELAQAFADEMSGMAKQTDIILGKNTSGLSIYSMSVVAVAPGANNNDVMIKLSSGKIGRCVGRLGVAIRALMEWDEFINYTKQPEFIWLDFGDESAQPRRKK